MLFTIVKLINKPFERERRRNIYLVFMLLSLKIRAEKFNEVYKILISAWSDRAEMVAEVLEALR